MNIKSLYQYLNENIPQFREFKKQIENMTTEEIMEKYNIEDKEQDN